MSGLVEIYTDGACRGNPGPGGWGAILVFGNIEKELCGSELSTTNNRMELTAAIKGLSALNRTSEVLLVTDSQYVQKGVTEWLPQWIARGWQTASRQPVKNVDLWQQIPPLITMHQVEWRWVKGHAGHDMNERADRLANTAIDNLLVSSAD